MSDADGCDADGCDAGRFSEWLARMQAVLRSEETSEVPCGTCTACCTSSQFVHIGPGETDTLAHIPKALLFPAPGLPRGHVLMGYDERGHCPMLVDGACSIYDHRPRTCRTYDCRVFPASGRVPVDKPRIAQQARRWRFAMSSDDDSSHHEAVRAASRFLDERDDVFPRGLVPRDETQLAVLAIELAHLFVDADPEPEAVRREVTALMAR